MFLVKALEVLLVPFLVLGGTAYAAYRLVKFLESAFGIGPGAQTAELEASMLRARELVERIKPRLTGRSDDQVLLGELESLVDARLPTALGRQQRLLEHLGRGEGPRLVREERDLQKKLQGEQDPELMGLLQRNLDLVHQRQETLRQLELASRRADAQIRAVLMNLEAFEDRLVVSEFDTVQVADTQIEALVEDVKLLEAAYDELKLED